MALTTTYYDALDGRLVGENSAGVQTDYLTDALGSVTATVNQSVLIVNEYRYKPYGTLFLKSGGGSDPAFRWVGSLGYRGTELDQSDYYIRARHYASSIGAWLSLDPETEPGSPYTYCVGSPTYLIDPSGKDATDCIEKCNGVFATAFQKCEKAREQCYGKNQKPPACDPPFMACIEKAVDAFVKCQAKCNKKKPNPVGWNPLPNPGNPQYWDCMKNANNSLSYSMDKCIAARKSCYQGGNLPSTCEGNFNRCVGTAFQKWFKDEASCEANCGIK